MANSIVRKIINYLKVPYLTAPERRMYEKMCQEITNNPDKLTKIVTANTMDYAYSLDGETKMIVSHEKSCCRGYTIMPNGTVCPLYYQEPIEKLLLETANRVARRHNISYAKINDDIKKYVQDFRKKHTR